MKGEVAKVQWCAAKFLVN